MIYFFIIPDVVLWFLLLFGYGMVQSANNPSFEQKILVYLLAAYLIACILPIFFFLKSKTQSSNKVVLFLHYVICTLGIIIEAVILMENQSDITFLGKRCILMYIWAVGTSIINSILSWNLENKSKKKYRICMLFSIFCLIISFTIFKYIPYADMIEFIY